MDFQVIYYEDSEGVCEIDLFLDSLDLKGKAKVMAWISKLEESGNQLHRPFADYLRDNIYELRITLRSDNVRILYFFIHRNKIILSHSFIKKTAKVPDNEIEKAIRNRSKYIKRIKE